MDQDLLDSASDIAAESADKLELKMDDEKMFHPITSPCFYYLDRFDSKLVKEYLNRWTENNYEPMPISLEHPEAITYLIKLHERHPSVNEDATNFIQKLIHEVERNQNVRGRISNEHSRQLRILVNFEPNSTYVDNAVDYFISEILGEEIHRRKHRRIDELANGILALVELDYHSYEEEINQAAEELTELIQEQIDEGGSQNISSPAVSAMALTRIPKENPNVTTKLIKSIKYRVNSENTWTITDPDATSIGSRAITHLGVYLIGLLSIGEGPKKPVYQTDVEKKIQTQKMAQSRPRFVSTFPTSELQTRRKEIYTRAKSIIESVEEELRISTQMIDMLHEDILGLIEENPDIQVRILARRESTKGDRRKMKEAVINELVRAGKTEIVRGDELLHSRMLIGDDRELIVSSADLTRDQLYDEFNAGIYTRDPNAVQDGIEYFDQVWEQAESLDVGDID